jgi:Capsule assembly protein Wzi
LPHLDFRFETYSTWLYRKDEGGNFLYWNNQYRDSYTNKGNFLGSWVGRDARAYTAETNYWFSAKSKITGNYRQIKAGNRFLPGGTQTDISVTAQWAPAPEWLLPRRFRASVITCRCLAPQA